MLSNFSGSVVSLALFIEGLTLVCMIGTALLWGVFGFLYIAERNLKQKQ